MIHHVYANRSNVGDWLSAKAIQQLIGRTDVVEHLCDAPFVPTTLEALKEATSDDLIVIGGGGLFMDYFLPFWRGLLPIARHVPFCIWGVGVCDMVRENSLPEADVIAEVVRLSALCSVRDDLTRTFLQDDTLPPPVACPVFNILPTTTAPGSGVMLHVDHFDNVGAQNFERMEAIAAEFAAATGRVHHKINNTIAADDADALERTIDLYRSADVILTSRLHGCLIASALGRPFLAVSGDRKVDAYMHAAGLDRWLLQLDEIEEIPARLEALVREPSLAHAFADATREANVRIGQQVAALASG